MPVDGEDPGKVKELGWKGRPGAKAVSEGVGRPGGWGEHQGRGGAEWWGLKEQGLSQDGGEYRSGLGRQEGGRVPP